MFDAPECLKKYNQDEPLLQKEYKKMLREVNGEINKVKQGKRERELHEISMQNPFYEAQFMDGMTVSKPMSTYFEPIIKEENMREITKKGEFEAYYGFKCPEDEFELEKYFENLKDKSRAINLQSIFDIDAAMLPRKIQIISKDFLERSINFINPRKIQEKELMRICILFNKSVLIKKVLSYVFWIFLIFAQKQKTEKDRDELEALSEKLKKFLQSRYFLMLTRMGKNKDKILELLPILIAKSVMLIYHDNITHAIITNSDVDKKPVQFQAKEGLIDEVFGVLGFKEECPLYVY
jgi:hypothetical protein